MEGLQGDRDTNARGTGEVIKTVACQRIPPVLRLIVGSIKSPMILQPLHSSIPIYMPTLPTQSTATVHEAAG